MDYFMGMTQGDSDQQEHVTEIFLRAIKENFPSVPEEIKDSMSLKKALQGDGSWLPVKEILGWIFNTKQGTLQPPRKAPPLSAGITQYFLQPAQDLSGQVMTLDKKIVLTSSHSL